MLLIKSLPWKEIIYVVGGLALIIIGWRMRGNKEEKKELEAQIEQQKDINEAQDVILKLEQEKQKEMKDVEEHSKNDSDSKFVDYVNSLLSKIWKTRD